MVQKSLVLAQTKLSGCSTSALATCLPRLSPHTINLFDPATSLMWVARKFSLPAPGTRRSNTGISGRTNLPQHSNVKNESTRWTAKAVSSSLAPLIDTSTSSTYAPQTSSTKPYNHLLSSKHEPSPASRPNLVGSPSAPSKAAAPFNTSKSVMHPTTSLSNATAKPQPPARTKTFPMYIQSTPSHSTPNTAHSPPPVATAHSTSGTATQSTVSRAIQV